MGYDDTVKVNFLGGVNTVTGSCHLLTAGGQKILIDCGVTQGVDIDSDDFVIPLSDEVDYCILTHAHLDHSGLLPLLVKKKKIRKNIISTTATKLVAKVLLEDFANIYYRQYNKVIYNDKDLENTFNKWLTYDYDIDIALTQNLRARLYDAAHIIGSSSVYITYHNEYDIMFSGDIGTKNLNLMDYPPKKPDNVSYLVLESTYGDKTHNNNIQETISFILNVLDNGGKVIIPAFSVGRAQEVIYLLNKHGVKYTIYLDSPMANTVTDLSNTFRPFLKQVDDIKENLFNGFIPIKNYKQSLELTKNNEPCVIISASGMLTGGRVLHHIDAIKNDERSAVVFVGYQAEGTRGRRLLKGEEKVKCKIFRGDGFSAHADREELIKYVLSFKNKPNAVFLTHGEDKQRKSLQESLKNQGIETILPDKNKPYIIQKTMQVVENGEFSGGSVAQKKQVDCDYYSEVAVEYFNDGILSMKKIKEFIGMMYIGKKTALSWLNTMYEKGRLTGREPLSSENQNKVYKFFNSCLDDLTLQDFLSIVRTLKQIKKDDTNIGVEG